MVQRTVSYRTSWRHKQGELWGEPVMQCHPSAVVACGCAAECAKVPAGCICWRIYKMQVKSSCKLCNSTTCKHLPLANISVSVVHLYQCIFQLHMVAYSTVASLHIIMSCAQCHRFPQWSHEAQQCDNTSSMMATFSDGCPSKNGQSQSKPHPAVQSCVNMALSACQVASTTTMYIPLLSVYDVACWHKQSYTLVLYKNIYCIIVNSYYSIEQLSRQINSASDSAPLLR